MNSNDISPEALQKDFFNLLDVGFERVTGFKYSDFATIDRFIAAIKQNQKLPTQEGGKAYFRFKQDLAEFYNSNATTLFRLSKGLGGMKLVLGGGSRFTASHLNAVRKMLLYTDTVLIPDPVFPWIEQDRKEEVFPLFSLLQNVFILLHLKPLVDANLAYPAVFVFPSFEKTLESKDPETINGINTLVQQFISFHTGIHLDSHESLIAYAGTHGAELLSKIEAKKLFVASGGEIGEPLEVAIERHRKETNTWSAPDFASEVNSFTDVQFVLYGLSQRLTHQFHLLENAAELNAQPMLCIPQHEYYYMLCTQMYSGRLVQNSLVDDKTLAIIRSLNKPSLHWLGNVPIDALAKMREQNENEDFRKVLEGHTKQLNESSLDDLNRVASEVGRGIASLLMAHQKQIREIEERYSTLHKQTAIGAWLTFAAVVMPALAPVVGSAVAPLAIATKYGYDKVKENQERSRVARSLTGILAGAKKIG